MIVKKVTYSINKMLAVRVFPQKQKQQKTKIFKRPVTDSPRCLNKLLKYYQNNIKANIKLTA